MTDVHLAAASDESPGGETMPQAARRVIAEHREVLERLSCVVPPQDVAAGICPRCGGQMRVGIAMGQTYTGFADFIGGDVVTVSPGGHGRLIACQKCASCGHSRTAGASLRRPGQMKKEK